MSESKISVFVIYRCTFLNVFAKKMINVTFCKVNYLNYTIQTDFVLLLFLFVCLFAFCCFFACDHLNDI